MAEGGRLSRLTGNEAQLLGRGAPAGCGVPPLPALFVFLPVGEAAGRTDERVDEGMEERGRREGGEREGESEGRAEG